MSTATPQPAIEVGECTAAHRDAVLELAHQCELLVRPTDLDASVDRHAWVAWWSARPGEIVGFLAARRVADDLEIFDLAVSDAHRRRGVGSALLAHALEFADAASIRAILLEVASHNQPAVQLYAKAGFTTVGVRKGYYPTGDDALLLTFSFDSTSRPD